MNKLNRLITYAYKNVPYYKHLFDEQEINVSSILTGADLNRIPILTKDIVRKYSEQLISQKDKINIKTFRTSGSTGDYLTVNWQEEQLRVSLHHLWQIRYKLYGIKPGDPYVTFHISVEKVGKISVPPIYYEEKLNELSFDSIYITKNVSLYYKKMVEFCPKYIRGAPSLLYILSDYIITHDLPPISSIKYIETSGEYLTNQYRKTIEKAFQVRIVNQYGCREANTIAIECPEGNLHVLTNNVIVEILENGKNVEGNKNGIIHLQVWQTTTCRL